MSSALSPAHDAPGLYVVAASSHSAAWISPQVCSYSLQGVTRDEPTSSLATPGTHHCTQVSPRAQVLWE